MPGYGIEFQPKTQTEQGQPGSGGSPLESVVKLLSLRLPTVRGAQGLAPRGLLSGGGGMGSVMGGPMAGGLPSGAPPDSAAMLQWLQQLLSGGGSTMPSVVPGIENPPPPGDIGPADLEDELRRRTGGNTGIGNTGRPRGPLGPAPSPAPQPPQDFPTPDGPIGPAMTMDRKNSGSLLDRLLLG